jgi:hypothetical protein
VPLVHQRWHAEHVRVERVHDELLRHGLVDERELLGADGVLAAEVDDEGLAPRPELAAECRAAGGRARVPRRATAFCIV